MHVLLTCNDVCVQFEDPESRLIDVRGVCDVDDGRCEGAGHCVVVDAITTIYPNLNAIQCPLDEVISIEKQSKSVFFIGCQHTLECIGLDYYEN